ncbi:hypothetical protein [Dactylosporangium cerinum]
MGLLLADEKDRLRFMAASDETTKLLELFQLQWQDGPCLDAFRTAEPVVNADLSAAAPAGRGSRPTRRPPDSAPCTHSHSGCAPT